MYFLKCFFFLIQTRNVKATQQQILSIPPGPAIDRPRTVVTPAAEPLPKLRYPTGSIARGQMLRDVQAEINEDLQKVSFLIT